MLDSDVSKLDPHDSILDSDVSKLDSHDSMLGSDISKLLFVWLTTCLERLETRLVPLNTCLKRFKTRLERFERRITRLERLHTWLEPRISSSCRIVDWVLKDYQLTTERYFIHTQRQATRRHGVAWQDSLRYRRPDLDRMPGLRRITICKNPMINDQGAQLIAEALKDDLWVKGLFWKIVLGL